MTGLFAGLLLTAVVASRVLAHSDKIGQCREAPTGTPIGACQPTARDIEGPYYKANAPFQPQGPNIPSICRHSPAYDRIYLNGTVRLQAGVGQCGAPTKALLDIWQANAAGDYSPHAPGSKDYTCRSRVYTRDDGTYSVSSIFPGRYDDGGYRPAHIHFKITPVDRFNRPNGATFTTQLYFEDDHYLLPVDSCKHCGSDEPTLIACVQHVDDIKTYVGHWDVLLAPSSTRANRMTAEEEFNDKHYN